MALVLPYEFDTTDVWRMILKGAFGFTLLIALMLLHVLISGQWAVAVPLALISAALLFFTRLLIRFQTGSAGTLSVDRVVIRPNKILGFTLPGPAGTYTLEMFSAVRVEFRAGPYSRTYKEGRTRWCGWWAGPARRTSHWRARITARVEQ